MSYGRHLWEIVKTFMAEFTSFLKTDENSVTISRNSNMQSQFSYSYQGERLEGHIKVFFAFCSKYNSVFFICQDSSISGNRLFFGF